MNMLEIEKNQNTRQNGFYLVEDRRKNVKDSFKLIGSAITCIQKDRVIESVCDIGCATGDLLYYLNSILDSNIKYTGIDINEDMLNVAQHRLPDVNFVVSNIGDRQNLNINNKFDITILAGALCLFNDWKSIIDNQLYLTSSSGKALVFSAFNSYGYHVKYEYSHSTDEEVKTDIEYVCSIKEISAWLDMKKLNYKWIPFNITTDIKKKDDIYPVRAWTQQMKDDSLLIRDQIDRIQEQYLLIINKN